MSGIIKRNTMHTEFVLIDSVSPHPKNMRQHDQANIEAIAASLSAFVQLKPIVVWKDDLIIAGCGTHEAAKSLGWTQIQIVRCLHLSENQAMEYLIADNKTTDMSEFDYEQLAVVMRELKNAGSDLASTGFSEEELLTLSEGKLFTQKESVDEPADCVHSITFTEDEWKSIVTRFVELLQVDKTLQGPKELILQSCNQCSSEFTLHCVKHYKATKPTIKRSK